MAEHNISEHQATEHTIQSEIGNTSYEFNSCLYETEEHIRSRQQILLVEKGLYDVDATFNWTKKHYSTTKRFTH